MSMNTKKPKTHIKIKRRLVITLSALALVVCLVIGFKLYFEEDTYSIVKDKVLVESKWLEGAKVLSQSQGSLISKDEQLDLHAKVSKDTAQEMVSRNIIKECVSTSERCTQPHWISLVAMQEKYPLATPYVSSESNTVVCTSHWAVQNQDGSTNNQDGICIDPETGDFWYTYYDV
jgi:hypothetical protein